MRAKGGEDEGAFEVSSGGRAHAPSLLVPGPAFTTLMVSKLTLKVADHWRGRATSRQGTVVGGRLSVVDVEREMDPGRGHSAAAHARRVQRRQRRTRSGALTCLISFVVISLAQLPADNQKISQKSG